MKQKEKWFETKSEKCGYIVMPILIWSTVAASFV